jgi:hypothetical protein
MEFLKRINNMSTYETKFRKYRDKNEMKEKDNKAFKKYKERKEPKEAKNTFSNYDNEKLSFIVMFLSYTLIFLGLALEEILMSFFIIAIIIVISIIIGYRRKLKMMKNLQTNLNLDVSFKKKRFEEQNKNMFIEEIADQRRKKLGIMNFDKLYQAKIEELCKNLKPETKKSIIEILVSKIKKGIIEQISIIGKRRSGKTNAMFYLLKKFYKEFPKRKIYLWKFPPSIENIFHKFDIKANCVNDSSLIDKNSFLFISEEIINFERRNIFNSNQDRFFGILRHKNIFPIICGEKISRGMMNFSFNLYLVKKISRRMINTIGRILPNILLKNIDRIQDLKMNEGLLSSDILELNEKVIEIPLFEGLKEIEDEVLFKQQEYKEWVQKEYHFIEPIENIPKQEDSMNTFISFLDNSFKSWDNNITKKKK